LRETGYAGTELGDWGFMPTNSEQLRVELQKRNVAMVGAFVPVSLKHEQTHPDGEARAVKIARLLSSVAEKGFQPPCIVLADDNGSDPVRTRNAGRVTREIGLDDREWKVFARGAERIARAVCAETGLPTVFHHHCAGYVETPNEIARLLDMTDPGLLGLVFDTGHYAYGAGAEDDFHVAEGLEAFRSRIRHVHFKDCHPGVAEAARAGNWNYFEAVRHGVFCELGQGRVDFTGLAAALRSSGYDGWIVVEQDVLPGMGAPRESARRNRDYLRAIGF
jgi:inosose dehydratase